MVTTATSADVDIRQVTVLSLTPQGQTAFDVADEDVLGYLEELQKKQNLVSGRVGAQNISVRCDCVKVA